MACVKCCDACCVVVELSGFGDWMPKKVYGWFETVGSSSEFTLNFARHFGRDTENKDAPNVDVILIIGWDDVEKCPTAYLRTTVSQRIDGTGAVSDCSLTSINIVPPKFFTGQTNVYVFEYKKLNSKKIINPCTDSYFDFGADDATFVTEGMQAGRIKVKRYSRQGDGEIGYSNRLHAGDFWVPQFGTQTVGGGQQINEIIVRHTTEIVGSNSFVDSAGYQVTASPVQQVYSLTPQQGAPAVFAYTGIMLTAVGRLACENTMDLLLNLNLYIAPLATITVTFPGTDFLTTEVLQSTYPAFTSTQDTLNIMRILPRNAFGYSDTEGRPYRALLGPTAVNGNFNAVWQRLRQPVAVRMQDNYSQDGDAVFLKNTLPKTIYDDNVGYARVNLYARTYTPGQADTYGPCNQFFSSRYHYTIDLDTYIQLRAKLEVIDIL